MPKDPSRIDDILDQMKRTTPLGEQLQQAEIWEHWEELAGAQLAAHSRPKYVREKQLRVVVDSAVWMSKFGYRRWQVIKRINRMARRELISDIFLVLLGDGESLDDSDGGED